MTSGKHPPQSMPALGAPAGTIRRRSPAAVVVMLGFLGVISPPVGLARPGDTIEQKIRQANTPADHQALAAWYEQEAQAAHQLATRYFVMRDVLAAARAVEQKNRAGEHWAFIAKTYQEMAKCERSFCFAS
jgi:hypothetical protein